MSSTPRHFLALPDDWLVSKKELEELRSLLRALRQEPAADREPEKSAKE